MEAVAEKLNNALSHSKESIPITITGRINNINNKEGTFTEILEEPLKLDDTANYHVYLNDFTSWSNVPNVNESNRCFHYTLDPTKFKLNITEGIGVVAVATGLIGPVIEFPVSTQSIDTYNDFLQNVFTKRKHFMVDDKKDKGQKENIYPVKFTYDLTVMRVIMHVAFGVTV